MHAQQEEGPYASRSGGTLEGNPTSFPSSSKRNLNLAPVACSKSGEREVRVSTKINLLTHCHANDFFSDPGRRLIGARRDLAATVPARNPPALIFPSVHRLAPVPSNPHSEVGTVVGEGHVGDLDYIIRRVIDKRWAAFKVDQAAFEIKVAQRGNDLSPNHVQLMVDSYDVVYQILQEIIRLLRERYNAHKETILARITLQSAHLDVAIPGATLPLNDDNLIHSIMYDLKEVLSSKQALPLDESFTINVTIMDLPPLAMGAPPKKLGPTFTGPSYSTNSRFLIFPPDYHGLLGDTCLLTSLVLGLAYNKELRANVGKKHLNSAVTYDWKILHHVCKDTRHAPRAHQHLHDLTLEFCNSLNIDPNDWKNVTLAQLEERRPLLTRLDINLHIHCMEAGFTRIFTHPHTQDSTKETVTILAVEADEAKGLLHCGLIKRASPFFASHNFSQCLYCNKRYTTGYAKFHKCTGRTICSLCRRIEAQEEDYIDYQVNKDHCYSKIKPTVELACDDCDQICHTETCLKEHSRACKALGHCPDCRKSYRLKEGYTHRCGDAFCRPCQMHYNIEEGKHTCQLTPPKMMKKYHRKLVYDMETTLDGTGRHQPNAIGAAYETEPGRFHMITFYDDDLAHPQDGVIEENILHFEYWPERIVPKFCQTPKKTKSVYRQRIGRVTEIGKKKKKESNGEDFLDREAVDDDGYQSDSDGEEDLMKMHEQELREQMSKEEEVECSSLRPGSALMKFVKFLVQDETFYGYSIIAHNGAKFDTILLLKALVKLNVNFDPIFDGSRLLNLRIPALKMHFVDSYRYIKLKLAKFAERFPDMPLCEEKGIFPYRCNQPQWYDYRGEMPGEEWYLDDFADEKTKKEVKQYLLSKQGQNFNFKEELHHYLKQDVTILLGGVVRLAKEYMDLQEGLGKPCLQPFDPWTPPYFTSSSFVYALFRHFALPKDTVYLLENQRNARQTSKGELEWLNYLSFKLGVKIRTAFNHEEGQKKIGSYSLDGYVKHPSSHEEAFEFLGCLAHGHHLEKPDCPEARGMMPQTPTPWGTTSQDVYHAWLKKKACLEDRGIKVHHIWECDYQQQVREDPELQSYLEDYYKDGRPR